MPPDALPNPWKSFLSEIDAALNQDVELHCLGGFVAKVLYDLERETSDVDILPVASDAEIESALRLGLEGSKLHKKYKVHLQIVGIAPIPQDYEERLAEIILGASNIFIFLPSILTTSRSQKSSATASVTAMM